MVVVVVAVVVAVVVEKVVEKVVHLVGEGSLVEEVVVAWALEEAWVDVGWAVVG